MKMLLRAFPVVLGVLFLFNHVAYTQYGNRNWKQRSSIDLLIGGDLGFRIIDGNTASSTSVQQMSNRENYENYKVNYRFGLNYYHGLNHALAIKTGIRYANPGFSITSAAPFDLEQDINEVEKEFFPRGPEYKFEYQIIEVPLGIKYTLTGTICEPYFEAGIAPSFYRETIVKEEGYDNTYKNKFSIQENINTLNFISFLSLGGNFNLGEHWSGFTQLIGRYQINNLRKGLVTERIIGLGLEAGVRYYL